MEVLDTRDIPVRNQHHRSPPSPGDFPQSEHVPLFKNHRDVEHEDEPLVFVDNDAMSPKVVCEV